MSSMVLITLKRIFLGNRYEENIPSKIKRIRTISILNILFIAMLMPDILYRLYAGERLMLYSSLFLVGALLIARVFIDLKKITLATNLTVAAFLMLPLYHSAVIGNLYIPYFILLVAPLVCAIVLIEFRAKIIVFTASLILFFICNYLVTGAIFSNSLFIVALVPSFCGMMFFYNRLESLEYKQNKLIQELEEKNQEMILFSQMMSHDLKAPLRTIKGFSSILQRKLKKKDVGTTEQEYLGFINSGVDSMSSLIDDLLTYSQASTADYSFQNIDLEDFIEQQKNFFRFPIEQNKLIINTKNLTPINGNVSALKTVFQNLISNSIKYQPKDLDNHIATINIEYEADELYHKIYFSDNGIGIKAENLPKLFQPFHRFHSAAEYEGTGLGLSICKKILNKHDGDIYVCNSTKEGTCFIIEIAKALEGEVTKPIAAPKKRITPIAV